MTKYRFAGCLSRILREGSWEKQKQTVSFYLIPKMTTNWNVVMGMFVMEHKTVGIVVPVMETERNVPRISRPCVLIPRDVVMAPLIVALTVVVLREREVDREFAKPMYAALRLLWSA